MGCFDTKRDELGNQYLLSLHPPAVVCLTLVVVYRLNTFPLLHAGFIHMIVNIFALTPLLERFEAEHGSLPTLLLFTGRSFYSICSIALLSNTCASIRSPSWRKLHLD